MKSHVSMEQHKCIVCTHDYDTGIVLLDKRLRSRLEQHTVTGWGLCPECKSKYDQGYIALVEADPTKSELLPNGQVSPEGAYRIGRIAHIKLKAFKRAFNVNLVKPDGTFQPVVFITPDGMDWLETKSKEQ